MTTRRQTTGHVAEITPLDISNDPGTNQALRALYAAFNGLVRLLNLGLSHGDATHLSRGNFDDSHVEITTPSWPNVEFEFHHGLDRLPVGYEIVRKDRSCDVYDAHGGSWNSRTMWLACDTASATITLRVY